MKILWKYHFYTWNWNFVLFVGISMWWWQPWQRQDAMMLFEPVAAVVTDTPQGQNLVLELKNFRPVLQVVSGQTQPFWVEKLNLFGKTLLTQSIELPTFYVGSSQSSPPKTWWSFWTAGDFSLWFVEWRELGGGLWGTVNCGTFWGFKWLQVFYKGPS